MQYSAGEKWPFSLRLLSLGIGPTTGWTKAGSEVADGVRMEYMQTATQLDGVRRELQPDEVVIVLGDEYSTYGRWGRSWCC